MTKLKSALLGTAAAMMAVTGAQAADLTPEPTYDYVRICDQYGAKYYYIPQTETCMKIGGNVQWRATYTTNESFRGFSDGAGAPRADDDNSTHFDMLGRVRLNFDVREETEYGTLRAFVEIEGVGDDSGTLNMRHAYIQFAGFTMGHTGIPFGLGIGGGPNYLTISGDNGDSRGEMIYYTASFGNGFAIDVGITESDNWDPSFTGGGQFADPFATGVAAGGDELPDAMARIRVEQAWGSASLSGIVRDVESFGPNDNEIGWAVRGTLKANLPIANGGSVGILGTYTSGASNFAADYAFDGYINAAGNIELIDTWNVRATAEVGVTPNLNLGIWGGYTTVVDVEDFLAIDDEQTETWWNIGATATWSPVANLSLGLDVVYENEENVHRSAAAVFDDNTNDYWTIAVGATRSF